MKQLEMFAVEPPRPAPTRSAVPPPEFAPFPDALLRRLNATLRMVRAAERMPWSVDSARREEALFLAAVQRLPPDRRGDLAEIFAGEMSRLRAG